MSVFSGHNAGHVSNPFKHSSLCNVLKIEKPARYYETNSAGAIYDLPHNEDTEYGVFNVMKSEEFANSDYAQILRKNGFDSGKLLGSPSFAMNILKENAEYHFCDIDKDALDNINNYSLTGNLNVKTYLGDSIEAFLDDKFILSKDDFVHIDPMGIGDQIFEINSKGHTFFDVFEKVVASGAKTFLWYGYKNAEIKEKIYDNIKKVFDKHKKPIKSFDICWSVMAKEKSNKMLNLLGCGVACANVSDESFLALGKNLELFNKLYENAIYNGHPAPLSIERVSLIQQLRSFYGI